MTTDSAIANLFEQVNTIANSVVGTRIGDHVNVITECDADNLKFYFTPTSYQYDKFFTLKVSTYSILETGSDDVGMYTKRSVSVKLNFDSSYRAYNPNEIALISAALNKASELATKLEASLPKEIIERSETHEEYNLRISKEKTLKHCRYITERNSSHMRVESSKVLPAVDGTEYLFGEYKTYYKDKEFKVILTSTSTLLIRTSWHDLVERLI